MLASRVLGDRYELGERIGAGGYGEVWRARDLVLMRPVAVKLLCAGWVGDADTLGRFRAEARHGGRLCHENIARVYDYGEPDAPGVPYLVLELVDGLCLAQVLRGGPLGPARTGRIVAQTAAGLAAAHRAGVIHRDIKPGNLMIGPGGVVKITDFGISDVAGSAPVTATNLVVGTAAYLAPERAAGARATPAADLYALGIVAFECLAGAPPFTGGLVEVALAHRERPLPPLPAAVPGELAALIGELTAKDPAQRPGSAAEVARRAAQLVDRAAARAHAPGPAIAGRPVRPCAPTIVDVAAGPVPRAARRRRVRPRPGRRAALAVATAAATAVMAGAGLIIASESAPAAAQRPAGTPSSTSPPAMTGVALVRVSGTALIGQPVAVAVRELRRQGLAVRVRWMQSRAQPPGTVVSVQPGGPRPVGSLVIVTGALRPAGGDAQPGASGDDNGHGHGGKHRQVGDGSGPGGWPIRAAGRLQ